MGTGVSRRFHRTATELSPEIAQPEQSLPSSTASDDCKNSATSSSSLPSSAANVLRRLSQAVHARVEAKEESNLRSYGLPKLDWTSKQVAPRHLHTHTTQLARHLARPESTGGEENENAPCDDDDDRPAVSECRSKEPNVTLGTPWQELLPERVFCGSPLSPVRGEERGFDLQGCDRWKKACSDTQRYSSLCSDAIEQLVAAGNFSYVNATPPRLQQRHVNARIPLSPHVNTLPPPPPVKRWVEVQSAENESQWWREDCVWEAALLVRDRDRSVVLHWHGGGSNVCSFRILDLLRAMIFVNPDLDIHRRLCPLGYVGARRQRTTGQIMRVVPKMINVVSAMNELPKAPRPLLPPGLPDGHVQTVTTPLSSEDEDDWAATIS